MFTTTPRGASCRAAHQVIRERGRVTQVLVPPPPLAALRYRPGRVQGCAARQRTSPWPRHMCYNSPEAANCKEGPSLGTGLQLADAAPLTGLLRTMHAEECAHRSHEAAVQHAHTLGPTQQRTSCQACCCAQCACRSNHQPCTEPS